MVHGDDTADHIHRHIFDDVHDAVASDIDIVTYDDEDFEVSGDDDDHHHHTNSRMHSAYQSPKCSVAVDPYTGS